MITDQDIEGLLHELPYPFEAHAAGLWVLHDEDDHIANIVIHHDSPLLTVRVKVMEVPDHAREALFEDLLRLNASDLVHGAYGIEDDSIVITDTIQSPNLDLNELNGSIDSLVFALTAHYEVLSKYRKQTTAESVSE